MEQADQILKALKSLDTKVGLLDAKVTAIDLSITGDPLRGVSGIKQHIEGLQDDFHDHKKNDEQEFGRLNKIKHWIAGGFFVASGVVSTVVVLANLYIKTK